MQFSEGKKNFNCPICQGNEFDREEGKIDSKWGITAHKVIIFVCKKCRFILEFSDGNSIIDFD